MPDDHDALEQLRARIAEREAKAARFTLLRKATRKVAKDPAALLAALRAHDVTPEEMSNVHACLAAGQDPIPAYAAANVRGNIRRDRERLAELEKLAEQRAKVRATLAAEAEAAARPVCAECIEAAASDLGSIDHDGEPAPRVAEPGEVCTSAYHGEE